MIKFDKLILISNLCVNQSSNIHNKRTSIVESNPIYD